MHTYTPKTFSIPAIHGISARSIEEHIGLYHGYVKSFNAMTELIADLQKDSEKNTHSLSEIIRRRSFEFDGMRLHEHYFEQIEEGAAAPNPDSLLTQKIAEQFGGTDALLAQLRGAAMMRGPGWALLYFDPHTHQFHLGFSGEQHMGHFVTLPIVLALDVWEHAYVLDHGAAGKGAYVDAYINALNWRVLETRFEKFQ